MLNTLARATLALATLAALAVAAPGVGPSSAFAAEPTDDELRRAGDFYLEGKRLFDDELYAAAIENFKKAHAIIGVPDNLYNIAKSYERLGDAENCVGFYDDYVALFRKQNANKEPPDIVDVRGSIQKCRLLMRPEVTIGSEPFAARVYIDDRAKLLGQTPYKTTLDPGSYTIYLDMDGFQPFKETIEVRAGEPIKLFFKLEKLQRVGTINLSANVRGASVFIDGKNIGLTPYDQPIAVDEGPHQVTINKDEYTPFKEELEVKANESYDVRSEIFLRDPPTTWKGYVGWTSLVLGVGAGVAGFFAGSHADTFFSGTDDFEKFETLQIAGYATGGTLIGAGVLLIILEALDDEAVKEGDLIEGAGYVPTSVTPLVATTPDGLGIVGADVRF